MAITGNRHKHPILHVQQGAGEGGTPRSRHSVEHRKYNMLLNWIIIKRTVKKRRYEVFNKGAQSCNKDTEGKGLYDFLKKFEEGNFADRVGLDRCGRHRQFKTLN